MMFIFEQESTFKFDVMPFQKIDGFFFKRSNAMMFCVVLDVFLHGIAIRIADCECSVALLPFEMLLYKFFIIHPRGRTSLAIPDGVADREFR